MPASKKILLVLMAILLFSSTVFALTYTSSNYTLKNVRVVASGGKASSFSYSLNQVKVGSVFGGKAESASYSLDAANIDKKTPANPPNPPTVNPVTTPTNLSLQTLSGTKDEGSAIYLNGYLVVPQDNETTWSYEVALAEGDNYLIITARNSQGLESESVLVIITLDTIPPTAPSLNPITSPTNQNTQTLSGSKEANTSIWIDGVERIALDSQTFWSKEVSLSEGRNIFDITAKDEAGNESQATAAFIFLDTSTPTTPQVSDDGAYTTSTAQLHASWSSSDPQTGIVQYQYAIGTTVGGKDTVDWTSIDTQTEITHTGLSLFQAQTYCISVKAKNAAGSWSQVGSSDGITVNQNIPSIIEIQPPGESSGYVEDNIQFSVNAQDADGDSLLYQFSLDGQIIQPWQGSPNFNWPTSGIAPGIHTIKVQVSDSLGGEVFQNLELCLFRKPPALPL